MKLVKITLMTLVTLSCLNSFAAFNKADPGLSKFKSCPLAKAKSQENLSGNTNIQLAQVQTSVTRPTRAQGQESYEKR